MRSERPHSPTADVPTTADRVRQSSVTLAEILCVVGTLMGTGVIGSRVAESAGGSLSAQATHLAPAGPAFSIWSVVYLGLLGYTVWQWLPRQATAPRHRSIGTLVVASMLLNAVWLLVTQFGLLWLSVGVIVALLTSLFLLLSALQATPQSGLMDRLVTDVTFGLYTGWVTVAVVANVAAASAASGFRPQGTLADVLGCAVLAVVAVIGSGVAFRFGARWSVTTAMVWGLGWLAYGRLVRVPASRPIGVAALLAVVVVVVSTAIAARRVHESRSVGKGQATHEKETS